MENLKILFLGEIVGKSGVFVIKNLLSRFKNEHNIDFVIANGEGATRGFGLGKNHSIYLHKLGVNCITSGECIYYKLDMVPHIGHADYILRPVNYPERNPGRGWGIYEAKGIKIGVVNILGQSGFSRVHLKNPFTLMPRIVSQMKEKANIVIVDFHAATTGEKQGFFFHMDGQVTAIIGTHSKVLTADERLLPQGTAIITDAGRCGSINSVGGLDTEIEIRKFLTGIPEYSKAAWENLEMQGVVMEITPEGKALSIERFRIACEEIPDERTRNNQ
ncbi:MAG: YmdB family metallophosphoesterase [Spirochaetales bacterium]|nr:YmdB family metallophosphoesterase [Spirochaetales bacterium]